MALFGNLAGNQGFAALDDWQRQSMPAQQYPIGFMPPQYAGAFAANDENGPVMRVPESSERAGAIGGGLPGSRRPGPVPLSPVAGPPLLGEQGPAPAGRKEAAHRDFFGRLGQGISRVVHDPDFGQRLAGFLAGMSGDEAGANRMVAMIAARQSARASAAQRQSLSNNLMKQGMDPAQVEIVMANPEAFATEYAARFRTREAAPGETINTPNLAGAPTIWQAPIAAEQAARSAGLQPGTPQFNTFIQDATLNAQGPTGTATTRRGQDITERDSIRSTGVSERNNIRTTGVAARGQDLSHTDRVTDPRRVPPGSVPSPSNVIGRIMDKQARGEPLTAAEQQTLAQYRAPRGRGAGRAGGGAPVPVPGRVATNAQGIRIQQMSNGAWVPVR